MTQVWREKLEKESKNCTLIGVKYKKVQYDSIQTLIGLKRRYIDRPRAITENLRKSTIKKLRENIINC